MNVAYYIIMFFRLSLIVSRFYIRSYGSSGRDIETARRKALAGLDGLEEAHDKKILS